MKDYNYYKTIAEICDEANDVYKKFKVEEIIPLGKIKLNKESEEGDSFLLKSGESKYLMVETSTDFYWVGVHLMLSEINGVNASFAKHLHDYEQNDHNGKRRRLFVFSYIEGEPLKDYLAKINKEETYMLGKSFGNDLRKVHLKEVDVLNFHIPHWYGIYKYTQKDIINESNINEINEKAYAYYKENEDIIYERYSTDVYYHKIDGEYVYDENGNIVIEKVLSFIFGDIRVDNLIVSEGNVYIKCPINIDISDPFYDFKYLSLIALESEEFARGIIDGYFEGKVSRDFFKMLKYYTSELIIKESEKTLDSKVVENIYSSYEDYNLEIPKWYKK